MKKILLLLFLFTANSFAQNAQTIIDGLKKELKNNPNEKKRATIYSDLTWYYSNISTDSALIYGNKAIVESTKLKDSVILAQTYSDIGAVYFRKSDFEASKKSFLKAYSIRKIRNDKDGMAKISANLANIYNKENKKKLALKSYLEAVDYFEKINNLEAAAITNANIGVLFNDLKNYIKSQYYLKKAIDHQEKNNQQVGLSTSYLTMGNIYLRLKDTLNALKFYEKSIVSSKKTGNNVALSSAYNNISKIKRDQNKVREVDSLLNKSKEIRKKLNQVSDDSSYTINVALGFITNGKFKEAKELLLKLKKEYTSPTREKADLLEIYHYLIVTCSYLNEKDTVNFYNNMAMKLKDVVVEETVQKQTNEFETKYQTAKKEKLLLQKEAEAKQKNVILIGLSALAILIGLIGFLIYRQQKLKNKQQEQEYDLKQAISRIENQNKLQEQRLSISRDLHDNIGSQLTFIISSVDNVKYGFDINNDKLESKLTNISTFAKDTIVELRDTIWAMNSTEITFQDLENRINNFIEKAKEVKDEISFSFATDEDLKAKKLTSVEGMNVYRTIQEAINNSIKYADADIISITIKQVNSKTNIFIKDNGKGFDYETIEKGNGINNMKKRIEEIGGNFNLSSSNEGTKIEIMI